MSDGTRLPGIPRHSDSGAEGLYPRLLGSQWSHLAEPVQRLHRGPAGVRAEGRFDVRRGTGPLARWIGAALGLPPAGTEVPVRLSVDRRPHGERWHRTFGTSSLVTEQRERPDGLLAERLGLGELYFRLEVADGGLILSQTGAALCLGRLRVPLPRFFAPRADGHEAAAPDGKGVRVGVRLTAPLAGLLAEYEGIVELQEPHP